MAGKEQREKATSKDRRVIEQRVSQCVDERLRQCKYAFYLNSISWSFQNGQLVLAGRVPTFQLKHLLETLVRDIPHVETVINNVDVVNPTGLSTTQPDGARPSNLD